MDPHLVYLCRFAVRAAGFLASELFSKTGRYTFDPKVPASRALPACHLTPTRGCTLPSCPSCAPPAGTGLLTCYPSPTLCSLGLGPTNPTRTDLPSETLDLRRTGFSPVSRYSCHHSHSCTLHHAFQHRFHAYTTLSYHFHPALRCPA